MTFIYNTFEEVEESIRAIAPPILYKYRDWSNTSHKKVLTENELWFAHPKTLNDPHDIRVPLRFNLEEVDHPIFLKKIQETFKITHPNIVPGTREFDVVCENQIEIIKEKPDHFINNYKDIREGDSYDMIGVLCLGESCIDEPMWAHYGNGPASICIGFDTVELARVLQHNFSKVRYQDEPIMWSFLRPDLEIFQDTLFTKHSKWAYEKEWRFITPNINSNADRIHKLPPSIIKEVILGLNMDSNNEEEIKEVLRANYNRQVLLFKVAQNESSYGFKKIGIQY